MQSILTCVTQAHDPRLMLVAGFICVAGIYASFAVANQAGRSEGAARRNWAGISIVAAGCTAWATHMIALLAFDPGMAAGFEPIMTTLSLLAGIGGIGLGMVLVVGRRHRLRRKPPRLEPRRAPGDFFSDRFVRKPVCRSHAPGEGGWTPPDQGEPT